MPELPEVETMMRGLIPHMEQRRIIEVTLYRPNLRFDFPSDFVQSLTGARIMRLARRGKYLLSFLEKPDASSRVWLSHLGMSGKFHIGGAPFPAHTHCHMRFDDGGEIYYTDPRRFGFMDLYDDMTQSRFLSPLGVEPLGDDLSAAYLFEQLMRRSGAIKTALLDQHIIAGLGNIYVCEALFLSRIHPLWRASDVTMAHIEALVTAIKQVLARAIVAGGSTLRDFADASGQSGYFQHDFAVYGRDGEHCSQGDCDAIIERIVQAGRSSFYCPSCQQ